MKVRVLRCQGAAALVEWIEDDLLQRAVVPAEMVEDGQCDSDALAAGIPYGVPFEDLLQPAVTPRALAQALRRRGIWTTEDVYRKPNEVIAALQSAYGLDLAAIQAAVRED